MKNYSVRTDLALEEKERFASDNVEVQGVVLEEEYDEENEIRLTRVVIETENGEDHGKTDRHLSDTGISGSGIGGGRK